MDSRQEEGKDFEGVPPAAVGVKTGVVSREELEEIMKVPVSEEVYDLIRDMGTTKEEAEEKRDAFKIMLLAAKVREIRDSKGRDLSNQTHKALLALTDIILA